MFKEIPSKKSYNEFENEILEFWKKNSIFQKSIHEDGEPFIFYEGPPTANGKPGIHHVMARTVKDTITRYRNMKGFRVERKAGWDTHGLPVEIQVEKELKIEGREAIMAYGLEKFNHACRNSVFEFKDHWDRLTERMGYWVDLEHPYITCDTNYIESVWWILTQLFQKGLIYKGYKIQPYCPKCGTSLSSHEVSQGYQDVKDLTAIVRFPLIDEADTFFLAWTTTPWTLPSNMALAVGPEISYVKIKHILVDKFEYLILAKDLLSSVINDEYEIIEEMIGKDLLGLKYEPLFRFIDANENSHQILAGDFVSTSDGTGIVHMAPAYGEDDYKTCVANQIPVEIIVQADGTFSHKAGEFAGMDIKSADPEIITNLKHKGLLFRSQKMEHSYPHCWRHGSPLFYYAQDSWFIRTTSIKDRLIKNNKSIQWYPPEVGDGRFGKWLENNIDWALSRKRYWGTPLNIWVTADGTEMKSIGSREQLQSEIEMAVKAGFMTDVPESIELHKPYVDEIVLVSSTGEKMHRTPEVIDCWFDSGAMPIAQWHYPFENRDKIDQGKAFPADFICEGIDQTRGWFYTLLAISTMLFDKAPYKNVIVNNLILDKDGQKMSKSKGNTVDPNRIIESYGVDTLRWFLISNSHPWIAKRFDEEAIVEVQRKYIGTLMNTYSFFALYANVDKFNHDIPQVPIEKRTELDKWILSLLYSHYKKVDQCYQNYDITNASRLLNDFLLNDVSNWYVRRNRRRFWKGELNEDKYSAYQTLYELLMGILKMSAPIMPFLSDYLYRLLRAESDPESIHMTRIPELNIEMENAINPNVERKMYVVQKVVEMARALRSEHQLKIRQPLSKISVYLENKNDEEYIHELKDIILEELNIKELELTNDINSLAIRKAKPDFKKLGPRFGKSANRIAETIRELDSSQISNIQNGLELSLEINGEIISIHSDLFEVINEKKDGLVVSSDEGYTIAIDTMLSPELIMECKAREFVSKVQNLRKDNGFDLIDRIQLLISTNKEMEEAILFQSSYIQNETLCEELRFIHKNENDGHDLLIEGIETQIKIVKHEARIS